MCSLTATQLCWTLKFEFHKILRVRKFSSPFDFFNLLKKVKAVFGLSAGGPKRQQARFGPAGQRWPTTARGQLLFLLLRVLPGFLTLDVTTLLESQPAVGSFMLHAR